MVAGASFVALMLASAVLALLAKGDTQSFGSVLTTITMLAAGAFGANYKAEARSPADEFGSFGFTMDGHLASLSLCMVAMAVAVVAFRRITKACPSGLVALGDAARTALILATGVLVLSFARSDFADFIEGFGEDSEGMTGQVTASGVGAFFGTFLITMLVLGLTCLTRTDWWGSAGQRVAAWAAAPLRGWTALLLGLPIVGVLGYLMLLGGESYEGNDTDWGMSLAVAFAVAANWGYAVTGIGLLAPAGYETRGSGGGSGMEDIMGDADMSYIGRVGTLTNDDPGLWASIPVALLFAAAVTWFVLRRVPRDRVLPALGVWMASLVVGLPFLGWFASGRGSMDMSGDAMGMDMAFGASMELGASVVLTTIMGLIAFGLVAAAFAFLFGDVDLAAIRGRAGAAIAKAHAYESDSGDRSGPPPAT